MTSDFEDKFISFLTEIDARKLRKHSDEEYKEAFVNSYNNMVAQDQYIIEFHEKQRQLYPGRLLHRSCGISHDTWVLNVRVVYSKTNNTLLVNYFQEK